MIKTAVIALGGNALIKPGQKGTFKEQLQNIDKAMDSIVSLVKQSYKITITHGNGPQVGQILLKQELTKQTVPELPLYVCVAESQALIGYMIEEALYNKLHRAGIDIPVITMITEVLVDSSDSAFKRPTKPIGSFYKSKAGLPKTWHLVKTLKGYRRVVASPKPLQIIEADAIKSLIGKAVLIAAGGGGIPVIKKRGLRGIDAVIDKDLAAQLLAKVVDAHELMILTDIDSVYLDYGKPGQSRIAQMNIKQARQYLNTGQFPPGSMGPKIQAGIAFLENGGKRVIITSFDLLDKAMKGKAGTVIK